MSGDVIKRDNAFNSYSGEKYKAKPQAERFIGKWPIIYVVIGLSY